ncbi:hypothetical protein Mal15_19050 [Stieleria maiorica]|uniref:Uncharacterized protein n=1 Tax=Stieleria maiorica TaxID=2795974 RepID=A0A5B9MBF0_9BACT|nr:hypothetical protein [Stieleria maiorica]QEF97859.1 hypothetical protein Mal15_19050 [Stieleria maiorica]
MAKKKSKTQRSAKSESDHEYSFTRARAVAKKFDLSRTEKIEARKNLTSDEAARSTFAQIRDFHREVKSTGGVREIRGDNEQATTQILRASQLLALDNQFVVATVNELVSQEFERGISRPTKFSGQLFHAIMCKLTFPDGKSGTLSLLERAGKLEIKRGLKLENEKWDHDGPYPQELLEKIECKPLVWLLTQYVNCSQEKLATLLSGTNMDQRAMESHLLGRRVSKNYIYWPFMDVSNQYDLMSYLVSGVAALVRLLNYSGLIIAFDRIGEWRSARCDTREYEQGVGAFVWAAIAPESTRTCDRGEDGRINSALCQCGDLLKHTGTSKSKNAYPFTISSPVNLGVLYVAPQSAPRLATTLQGIGAHEVIEVGD